MSASAASSDNFVPRWELALAIALVIASSSALFPLLYAPTTFDFPDPPWLRALWLPVYSLTVLLIAGRWQALWPARAAFLPTAALLLFIAASLSWSIAPDITLRRLEALSFNALMAFYLAARFTWPQLVRIVAAGLLFLAVGSLLMAVGFPSIGIHTDVNIGAWRGLWVQKNELGFMMLMGSLSSLAAALTGGPRRIVWLFSAALCAALLVMARSGTSLICLLADGMLLLAFAASRKRPAIAVVATFVAGCVVLALAVTLVVDSGLLLRALGKDPTLTGRTDVWAAVMRRISERPALGYGYAAFWHDRFGPALLIRQETGWEVPDAHNGWLEVALQLGWVGCGAVGCYLALTTTLAVWGAFARPDGYWSITYLLAFLILSGSESQLLRQNSLEWILLMATSMKLTVDATSRLAVRSAGQHGVSEPGGRRRGAGGYRPAPGARV